MSLEEVVKASTMKPAEVIGSLGLIGTLKPGACADITVMRLTEGKFQLSDSVGYGNIREVDKLLKVNNVIRGGRLIF
jgi:dihydroorotase